MTEASDPAIEAAMAHLLDFSRPFDCSLLEQFVQITMDGKNKSRNRANEFLVRLKEHPDMWRRADAIIEGTSDVSTKIFGLQILQDAVNTRWKIIPADQREGIRNYIVSKIISYSTSQELLKTHQLILGRLNLVLVQILKHDWPHNWPSFISDLVGSSKTSEFLCENNMKILKLLSEEIFDFSKDTMTSIKVKSMKESLNGEFSQIFELCNFIISSPVSESLLTTTLDTMQRFLSWIPLGYIFETQLVPTLIEKFLTTPQFRTLTLDCLTEIASLPPQDIPEKYRNSMKQVLASALEKILTIIPRGASLVAPYENGSEEDCLFIQRLALFLCTYLKSFLPLFDDPITGHLKTDDISHAIVIETLMLLLRISEIQDEELFKICLEFWPQFSKDLYTKFTRWKSSLNPMFALAAGGANGSSALAALGPTPLSVYDAVLHELRVVMIDHMAKPEEVIVVEDDNGEIVREMVKDTEVIAQYKTMREALIYLTNLNNDDAQSIMLEKLDEQVTRGRFTWNGLNTLCWAIGSVSGAMSEMDEKRFLVSVIKDLLRLCEEVRGKDNKAVVASNIMYIVGQYPRFLRAHWKFLKTVVNKLFEFMHEHHPGVQDMSCDTFLKISQKCKRKFMTVQVEDSVPFIITLIDELPRHINDLQPHQILSFYESAGTMLSDHGAAIAIPRDTVLKRLMELTNACWRTKMQEGMANVQALLQLDAIKELQRILKVNIKVCGSAGSIYIHQLSDIFLDMMQVYRLYSEQIIQACAAQGPVAARLVLYKTMRAVKGEILELLTTFFDVAQDMSGSGGVFRGSGGQVCMELFLPGVLKDVLIDYRTSPPAARDSKVLLLFSQAAILMKDLLSPEMPAIMDSLFNPTMEMISLNMLEFPEHRIAFFKFLRSSNEHCFFGLFNIPPAQQKLVVDSIVWASKHTERNISETGLEIMHELLTKVSSNPQISDAFYQAFLLSLLQDVLFIMTDRLHKSGFRLQSFILKQLCHEVAQGKVRAPLFPSQPMSPTIPQDNCRLLQEHMTTLLHEAFANVSRHQISGFVVGFFDLSKDLDAFKQHLRDFLIAIKEFETGEDNSELFSEERKAEIAEVEAQQWRYRATVPGLLGPSEEPEFSEKNYDDDL